MYMYASYLALMFDKLSISQGIYENRIMLKARWELVRFGAERNEALRWCELGRSLKLVTYVMHKAAL